MEAKINWERHSKEENAKHTYYLSLGYDERTSAVLALYTYGRHYYFGVDRTARSIEDLYREILARDNQLEERTESDNYYVSRERRSYPHRRARSCITDVDDASDTFGAFLEGGLPDCAPASRGIKSSGRARAADTGSTKGGYIGRLLKAVSAPEAARPMEKRASSRKAPAGNADMAQSKKSAASFAPLVGGFPDLFATDEYESIEEKGFREALGNMTSTFRMTTNTASAGVILNQLRSSRRISRDMVRIEELLNYFRYKSVKPETEKFAISCEKMQIAANRQLLYINVQGREETKERQNIVILLDVSGSMSGNADQTQEMVATIISKLNPGDKVSLVTYCDKDKVVFSGKEIGGYEDKCRALEELFNVGIGGCTYGSAGIIKAYEIGTREYIEGGNNQVILITDGDLNFGITEKGGLTELIEEKKKSGLFLSVIGTGLYNYKDDKLEILSKHGNGVYRTVNNLADVKKCIDSEYASLVNIIAKDVKAQVEFNPEVVESYRLLGFENREISSEDFANDKVISEPFGSGGYGVALYELVLREGRKAVESDGRYVRMVTTGSTELGTVKVRFKEPLAERSEEIEYVIPSAEEDYSDNLRLAFVVYVCAEKLRLSDKISGEDVKLAQKLYDELGEEIREMNKADLPKLAEILKRTDRELNTGIHARDPFEW